ncbi:MAG: alpha/beta hydrolase [Holosporaceae bacterium]|jgi:acetyl esterase|nr:alpha/beta hydrolase [Holosporaceae bacterium]
MYQHKLSKKSTIVIEDLSNSAQKMLQKAAEKNLSFSPQMNRCMANDFFIRHAGVSEQMEKVENFFVVTDNYEIPARRYVPTNIVSDGIILFAHGGGWIQGNLDTHDYLCRKIAKILEIEVIAMDYRLAPEFMFPIPLEDFCCAYQWCINTFVGKKIILAGDSAGGNLCAALCVKLANEMSHFRPHVQVLFYPVLSNDFSSPSYDAYDNRALTKIGTMASLSWYVGKSCLEKDVMSNTLVYPLLQKDMSIFPRTVLIPAQCDILLDGQLSFAEKLQAAGTKVDIIQTNGTIHGFMTYGKEFEDEITHVLEEIKKLEFIEEKNEYSKNISKTY